MSAPWLEGAAQAEQPWRAPDPIHGPNAAQNEPLPFYRDVIPRVVNVANPGAGVQWSAKPEGGRFWHVQSITATYNADAVALSRDIALQVSDGSTILYTVPNSFQVTANQTPILTWIRGIGAVVGSAGITFGVNPWPQIPVLGGQTISSTPTLGDAGDTWTGIALYVYEVTWMPLPDGSVYPEQAETWRRQYPSRLLEEVN